MKRLFFGLATTGLILLVSSCGKIPQAEIDATRAAIDSAKAIGAEQYLPGDYMALQDSMAAVLEKIETEKSKWFRNFDGMKAELQSVTGLAHAVSARTDERIAEVKEEIQNLQVTVQNLQQENRSLLGQAPKGKEGTAALEAIGNDISLVEATLAEAGDMFNAGSYLAALDKARAAHEKAVAINTELSEVIARYKSLRKR